VFLRGNRKIQVRFGKDKKPEIKLKEGRGKGAHRSARQSLKKRDEESEKFTGGSGKHVKKQ